MAEDKISLPPAAQQLIMQLQTYQQQLQSSAMQRESFSVQKIEFERALEELEKTKESEVYKSVGPILVKTAKEEMKKELKSKLEMFDLGVKKMEKQEEKIREKAKETQDKLKAMLGKPDSSAA